MNQGENPGVGAGDAGGTTLPSHTPTVVSRLGSLAMLAGLAAGLGAWLIGEGTLTAFRPPYEEQHVMGQTILKARFEDQAWADTKNAALAFAALGGGLGLSLGIAGGSARRDVRAGVKAGIAGLVLGGVLAAGAALALVPMYYHALDKDQEGLSRDLTLPLIVHAGAWAACGLAGGIAFGLGLGGGRMRLVNAAIGGLIGAALGAAAYEMLGAMVFPGSKTTSPLSFTWYTRLLARLLVASLAGITAAIVVKGGETPRAASGPAV